MQRELPSGWQAVSMKEMVSIKHGYAFKGEYFVNEPAGDVLVTPGNFAVGGGFQDHKLKYYRGPVDPEYVLKPGDLIVTMTDLSKSGDTLGYSATVPSDFPHRLLHNQRIGLISVNPVAPLSPGFLNWFMRTPSYRAQVLGSASGSTVRHTSPSRILQVEVPLPPLQEQRRIAAVLGALDDKIELNRRTNRTLEALAQTLFRRRFVTFDGHDRLVDSGTRLGEVPEGWEVLPLDKAAHFLNGTACQKYPAEEGEPSLPVIKIRELRGGITDKTDRANTDVPGKYRIEDGDFLFSWSGSLLAKVWTGGEGPIAMRCC